MKSGIYIITCLVNGKHYVGYAKNVKRRIDSHRCALRNNKHANVYLQNAFNEHGEENFSFDDLEYYSHDLCPSMENWWCNMLDTHNREKGYNIEPTNPYFLKIHSKETKLKIGKANTGKKRSDEVVERLRELGKQRKHTPEEIEKIRKAHIGSKRSDEARKRMSEAQKGKPSPHRGKPKSEEMKRKLSLAMTGKPSKNKGMKMKPEVVEQNRIVNQKFLYQIQTPNGEIVETVNLTAFSKENSLKVSSLHKTIKGKDHRGNNLLQHKGYKVISQVKIETLKQAA